MITAILPALIALIPTSGEVLPKHATSLNLGPSVPYVADDTIGAEERMRVVRATLDALTENYVFPEVAKEMEQSILDKLARGKYDRITSGNSLAGVLTTDLRAICKDLHLRVSYREEVPEAESSTYDEEFGQQREREARNSGYGFVAHERLEGNVALIDLRGFHSGRNAFEKAAEVMNAHADADAIIFDLRQNGGGAPSMVAFLCTYLMGERPVHLNDLVEPRRNYRHQWWTLPYVPGPRFGPDKPVYVLTSRRTFSAAEEFSYNLRCLERATLVGETTGGGAHPVDFVSIDDHFGISLPFARAENPITHTNWEGVGVVPHVPVNARAARTVSHILAVEAILEDGDIDVDQEEELYGLLERLVSEKDKAGG